MACNQIKDIQKIVGGKIVYLECENKEELLHFYKDNGFIIFNERHQEDGKELIQLLKYL